MTATKLIMHSGDTRSISSDMAQAIDCDTMAYKRKTHNDDGIELKIPDNMRGRDMICVPSSSGNPQTNFVEALSMLANANAGGAKSVTAVLLNPYSERADKQVEGRGVPMFHVMSEALKPHCDEVILVDPHNLDATTAFRNGRVHSPTNVNMAFPVAIQLKSLVDQGIVNLDDLYPVHADAGATKRITPAFRECVGRVLNWGYSLEQDDWAQAFNRRNPTTKAKTSEGLGLTGNIDGKIAVIFEDIGDTMGTLCSTAADLKKAGAKAVIGYVSKGIFSPKKDEKEPSTASVERINNSEIDLLLTTNAITHRPQTDRAKAIKDSPVIHTMSVGGYLGAYLAALHMPAHPQMDPNANSVSALQKGTHPDMYLETQKMVEPVAIKEGNPLLELAN